jgi:hypothetical protein
LSEGCARIHSRKEVTVTYCEDYPCCGHTPSDPCGYDGKDEAFYYAQARRSYEDDYYYDYE